MHVKVSCYLINNDIDSLISENKNGNPLQDIIYHGIGKYREEILEHVDLMQNIIWEIHINFNQDGKEDHTCTHKYNCNHR